MNIVFVEAFLFHVVCCFCHFGGGDGDGACLINSDPTSVLHNEKKRPYLDLGGVHLRGWSLQFGKFIWI